MTWGLYRRAIKDGKPALSTRLACSQVGILNVENQTSKVRKDPFKVFFQERTGALEFFIFI
jgi:heat shock protein HslJ